jgi:hypothetical protein
MNASLFTALFVVLIVIVFGFTIKQREGYQPTLHIPQSPVKQKNLVENSDNNYAPMAVQSLGAAPGAIATYNSLPYQDPSLEKAKYQRILNIETTLNGFLTNEAPDIEDMSDPSIQLPLNAARSDLDRLRNEILVLKRNPGIDSTLTQEDTDEIQANLAYLQKKWRLSIYNETEIEGFQDASGSDVSDSSGISDSSGSSVPQSIFNTLFGNQNSNAITTRVSYNATLSDLNNLISRISTAITSLSSSGTTDPVVLARVSSLQKIKSKVQAIINEVDSSARVEADIPITKDAYNNFLSVITNTNSPLPQIFGSNVSISDLFPAYSIGDASGAQFAQYLFNKYADILFKGLSWNVNVGINYHSEAEQNIANNLVNAINMNGINMNGINMNGITMNDKSMNPSNIMPYSPSLLDDSISNPLSLSNSTSTNDFSQLNNQYFGSNSSNSAVSTRPIKFNWQDRANFICDSIQKRGLNPGDFGCLKASDYVSDDFSWRGYSKMICSRLGTSYDTGLPEVCGCPSFSWVGWRS